MTSRHPIAEEVRADSMWVGGVVETPHGPRGVRCPGPSKLAVYHHELCSALTLDPVRATPEQVIALVGQLVTELEIMRGKRDRCAATARRWRESYYVAEELAEDAEYHQERDEMERAETDDR